MRLLILCVGTVGLWIASMGHAPAGSNAAGTARTLETKCHFETPRLVMESNGYVRVQVRGCVDRQERGKPEIPFQTVRLLLPPLSEITGISCSPETPPVILSGVWKIAFGRSPVPLRKSLYSGNNADEGPDEAVYQSADGYPGIQVELASVQKLAGYAIAYLRVFPVQYTPSMGRLVFSPTLNVNVTVVSHAGNEGAGPIPLGIFSQTVSDSLVAMVENPSVQQEYPPPIIGEEEPYDTNRFDYLLITDASLLSAFQPLIDFRAAQGLVVKTESMGTITSNYTGRDDAEKLRNYIRYAYTNWGIEYVLLGGDVAIVPTRGVYAACSGETETAMPSDLYFACLDGSWNGDGDSVWGEPNDGDGGGDVDLLAEVFVGRAPVETSVEVERFVLKTISAEADSRRRVRTLFSGEYLGYFNVHAQGGDALDRLLPAVTNSHSLVHWLDDRPGYSEAWNLTDALYALNSSPFLVAHYGHADDSTVMRFGSADVGLLTNAFPFLLYSAGCAAGWFDNLFWPDCIGEELVIQNNSGAFATIVNSRLGWFDWQSEWMYSGEFQQLFFNGLLTGGRSRVGEAHQLAKQDLIGRVESAGDMPYRWCYFGLILLGDPCSRVQVPVSLCFRPPAGVGSESCVIEWNSQSNATYSVFRSTNLLGSEATCLISNMTAVSPLNTFTDAVETITCAFYWIHEER